MPAFSHFYGLKPADIEDMTIGEIQEYERQLDEYEREIQRGDR